MLMLGYSTALGIFIQILILGDLCSRIRILNAHLLTLFCFVLAGFCFTVSCKQIYQGHNWICDYVIKLFNDTLKKKSLKKLELIYSSSVMALSLSGSLVRSGSGAYPRSTVHKVGHTQDRIPVCLAHTHSHVGAIYCSQSARCLRGWKS